MRPDDHETLVCPACGLGLVAQPVRAVEGGGRVVVDRCPQCHGWWFDGGELERVLEVAARDLAVADAAAVSDRLCPVDGKPMSRFNYPQTWAEVDMCRRCGGVWLDVRELAEVQKVRRHLRRTGELEVFAPIPGVRGRLIRFIDGVLRGAGWTE